MAFPGLALECFGFFVSCSRVLQASSGSLLWHSLGFALEDLWASTGLPLGYLVLRPGVGLVCSGVFGASSGLASGSPQLPQKLSGFA